MLKRFLDGPMKGVDEIVFAVRVPGRDHWYVTFGNYADHSPESPQTWASRTRTASTGATARAAGCAA